MGKLLTAALSMIVFYAGWWGLVALVSKGYGHLAPFIAIICAAINLIFEEDKKSEIKWYVVAILIGVAFDSLSQAAGILKFGFWDIPFLVPLWIMSLWLLFVSSFQGFDRFKHILWVCVLLGAVGGPFSYWAGKHFGLVTYGEPEWLMIFVHGVAWGIMFPFLVRLRDRLKVRWAAQARPLSPDND